MNKISCIVVDDDVHARDRMEILLRMNHNMELIGKIGDADAAANEILNLEPDLVFIDVEMPGKTGFDVVQEVREANRSIKFIFVTGQNQYAVKAIRNAAFDFLVKPVDVDELNEAIERFISEHSNTKARAKNVRELATIMFTDIVGYTHLMQENENLAVVILERYRKILRQQVRNYEGNIIQHQGDGTLIIFRSAINAVNCATQIQQELQNHPKVPVRIGLHAGEIAYDMEGIYGDSVNVASRVESSAVEGAVLLSDKVYDEIRNHPEFAVKTMGFFEFKNVKTPIELFAISNPGLKVPEPKELKGKLKD